MQNLSEKIGFFIALLGLQEKQDELINSYSHGMKQKLAVAASLISNPKFILLDESLNGMDSVSLANIFEYLKSISAEGKLVLISSHNVQLIHKWCDEVFIINKGKIISDIPQQELKKFKIEDDSFLKKYIELIK